MEAAQGNAAGAAGVAPIVEGAGAPAGREVQQVPRLGSFNADANSVRIQFRFS